MPSGDWKAIARCPSWLVATKAIADGVALVRPVSKKLIIAVDNYV